MTDAEKERAAIVAFLRGELKFWKTIAYRTSKLALLRAVLKNPKGRNWLGIKYAIFGPAIIATSIDTVLIAIERGDHLK